MTDFSRRHFFKTATLPLGAVSAVGGLAPVPATAPSTAGPAPSAPADADPQALRWLDGAAPALMLGGHMLILFSDTLWPTVIGMMAVTLATVAFTPPREEPHRFRFEEHGLAVALRRGGVAAFCAVAGIALVLATESFVAVAAALSICIFSSIIGSMADPRPVLKNLLPGATLGVLAGLVYRLGGDALGFGPEAMLLFAALFILAGAMIRATPRIAPLGLDGNMCFLLSAEVGARGHGPVLHVTSAIALLAGAGVMVLIYRALLARQLV